MKVRKFKVTALAVALMAFPVGSLQAYTLTPDLAEGANPAPAAQARASSSFDSCCDSGCGDSCCEMDACCKCPTWFASTEFLFLGVDAGTNGSGSIAIDDAGTGAVDVAGVGGAGYDDFTYAPRLALGRHLGELWSVAGRFWYLSDFDSEGSAFAPPISNIGAASDQHVRMYTIDVELNRKIVTQGDWKLDGAFGVRHGSFDINDTASTAAAFSVNDFSSSSISTGSGFDGTGLTTALTGRHQLGNSRAHLFASGRSSLLWGDGSSSAFATAYSVDGGGAGFAANGAIAEGDTELWINEIQVGIQWEFALRQLPAKAFFRTAFEYQNWDLGGDGNAFATSTAAATTTAATATARSGDAEIDLYGLGIATGFTW
jgi:hypothetical protein